MFGITDFIGSIMMTFIPIIVFGGFIFIVFSKIFIYFCRFKKSGTEFLTSSLPTTIRISLSLITI